MRRTGRVFQAGTQRRNLPHFAFACELARTGKLGKLTKVYAHPAGMQAMMSGWLPAGTGTGQGSGRLGHVPRPGGLAAVQSRNCSTVSILKRAAGWSAAACSNGVRTAWTSANGPSAIARRRSNTTRRRTANWSRATRTASELIFRETGWIPLGSCPVRFEGETGWVEAGDSGKLVLSSPELLAGRTVAEIGGYPATFHVRDFLDCVKTRSQPKGNADAACNAHIACHAANIALYLDRQVKYDNTKHEFINDEQANRLRSEALREPWRL